ncbi:MAG: DUF5615 family PIN-like protein [Candidatus Latescibacteria bacterium]|nr:DUF5615 family PIN-like protein [Candidatus Latescibacterota bacterium]
MAKLALFLDEDLPLALSIPLRKRGYDVIHAQELERKGRSDADQLRYAVHEHRCLWSWNVKDFVRLHNEYVQTGQDHWGIIVSKQRPVGEALRRILRLLQTFSQEAMRNRLEFL